MPSMCTLTKEVAHTSKLVEVVPNVVGLVIVPSVLVVNELDTSCKDEQHCLDKRSRKCGDK